MLTLQASGDYLLYERTTVPTALNPAQIGERLARNVQPLRWFRSSNRNSLPFEGRLAPSAFDASAGSPFEEGARNAFKLIPLPKGRDSWLTVIEGHLTSSPEGTRLHLTFRWHLFTMAFFVFWTVMLNWSGLFPVKIVMSVVAWSMGLVFFNMSRRRAKSFLLELLEATEVE